SRPASDLDLAALDEAVAAMRTVFAQIHASFALMLTAVGIPMFLAGEEFADLHDLPHHDWRLKMSDPVDWQRAAVPGHAELRRRVNESCATAVSDPRGVDVVLPRTGRDRLD